MQALILAGGSGTRFWPLSRRTRPKQLLSMGRRRSLLQITADRLDPLVDSGSIWVCTTEGLVDAVGQQLPDVPREQILAEPVGRNTAPAIGWSLSRMPAELRQEVVVVLPADHFVAEPEAFRRTLKRAAEICDRRDMIMTLAVPATRPETGYGYLELGEVLDASSGLRAVRRFTEKPDANTVRRFMGAGNYVWNAGIFLFRGSILLERLAVHQPELVRGLVAIEEGDGSLDEIYPELPAISIDHGLMEKLDDLGSLPLECGWSDLGSWEALWEQLEGDQQGNVRQGSVLSLDSRDNLLIAEEGTLAAVGVEGLVVVSAGDAVLVIPKDRSQEVRRIVAELEKRGRDDLL